MSYALWKAGKAFDCAVFELFFRTNPFKGEFTVFAGLSECLKFLRTFAFSEEDIKYIRNIFPDHTDEAFFDFLSKLDLSGLTVWAIEEGTAVFPNVPLLIVQGPLAVCQLLETPLLNLINYASLVTTNAARIRLAVGESKQLAEFGLRRAQGPNGGISASLYSFLGGFNVTSNVLAAKLYGIPICGTHSHSFVSAFSSDSPRSSSPGPNVLPKKESYHTLAGTVNFDTSQLIAASDTWLRRLATTLDFSLDDTKPEELQAFVHYASAFPSTFVGLVDTYSVLKSGVNNFCAVALALWDFGLKAVGVRIDSGDLAYLSNVVRKKFTQVAEQYGHSIDMFAVGTQLVTCQKQSALGCVFKLVEINGVPTAKLSENVFKMNIPGQKLAYRLFDSKGTLLYAFITLGMALLDLMQTADEKKPTVGERIRCRNAYYAAKFVEIIPSSIRKLHMVVWKDGKVVCNVPSFEEIRSRVKQSLAELRPDHLRQLNPTPYKVSLSELQYHLTQDIWMSLEPRLLNIECGVENC
ncbi:unnamed protein product [Schistocephalus solidus]|uniref:Nicotinate phosphoribosyltransferase n=1 Tax=Schistocephalus solidus TaxID=70667 RepID=A0A183SQS0_SCHSO|nr:unnamed protein product [Schistocephalus solidus]